MEYRKQLRRRLTGVMVLALILALSGRLNAEQVPGETWMRYAEVEEAGFDPARLDAAKKSWQALPSSAFMVVADGVVVAAWGEVGRRFEAHSVRKSFLSALYGIYGDQGEIELNKRLKDLGIDDHPAPLLETEREARILDLLKARSGVFHPAAYAGRTDSRPRGSEGPGRHFAYNNWDFNTLAFILRQETGAEIFTAFDEHFGEPLGMEDWRVSDGYYAYERDKSRYPAYPFRVSARDAARFGLLFAREGLWGDTRILSRNWVRRSTATYSFDDEAWGYGFMWWTALEPRFLEHGMYAARGTGSQMIAVLPDIDLVIVNRSNTYEFRYTPSSKLLDLVEEVLEARTGNPVGDPELTPVTAEPDPLITSVADDALSEFAGEWSYPPPSLGLPERGTVEITAEDGHLIFYAPFAGTFRLYLQPDGTLHEEDTHARYWPVRDDDGTLAGIVDAEHLVRAAVYAAAGSEVARARELLDRTEGESELLVAVGSALVDLLAGDQDSAKQAVGRLLATNRASVAALLDGAAEMLMETGRPDGSVQIYQLVTRIAPESTRAWTRLGEAYKAADREPEAISAYERVIELDPDDETTKKILDRLCKSKERC